MQLIAVCVLLAFGVTMVCSHKSFDEFKREYNKSYSNKRKMSGHGLSEEEIRQRIFEHNAEKIDKLNEKQNGSFAINKFADKTPEEFRRTHMGLKTPNQAEINQLNRDAPRLRRTQASKKLPKNWDWEQKGYVIPPKDQGGCGSCWAFAAIGALETYYQRKGYKPDYLSEQQIVDCDKSNGGCNGGWPFKALEYVKKSGIVTEKFYPYKGVNQQCAYNSKKVKLPKPKAFAQIADEKTLQEALYKYGSLPIALDASNFQFYQGGVFTNELCQPNGVNHAVLLVGYGTDENGVDFWRIKNSWGDGWGEGGFIRLKRGENTCNMISYPAVAITK